MKRLQAVATIGLVLALTAGMVFGGDHGKRSGSDNETYESKIYGTVEKIPKGFLGIWVVKGREVVVTKETIIKEKHGKAAVGAYVEVEGSVSGKSFTACEVKINKDVKK